MATKIARAVEVAPIPWPFWLVLVISFFGGTWSAYFLVWRNLKRMGESEIAKKFAIWGAAIIILYQVLLVVLASAGKNSSNLSQILLIGFPLWLEFRYFRKWREENPENKPKLQLSAIGWGVLGLVATLVMWYVTMVIAVKLGL